MFGPPLPVTEASTWPWLALLVSGLLTAPIRAIHARFHFAFAYRLKLGTASKSQDHASRGTPPPVSVPKNRHRAVTACKHTVSGTISLPSRGTFHLSLTVLVHYRSVGIFSLTEWAPWIHSRFHVTRVTQVLTRLPQFSHTGLSPSLERLSSALLLTARVHNVSPTTPSPVGKGLGFSLFVRHY